MSCDPPDPPSIMVGWLRDESGVRVPLGPSGTLIGRSTACSIVIDDPDVSRKHVLVLHTGGATQVIPLGRKQPSIRGVAVQGPTRANDGDELVIGSARFTFEIRADTKQVTPPSTSGAGSSKKAMSALATVVLERVPKGALLRIGAPSERIAFLPGKRADLVTALLRHAAGAPGDWIEDHAICEQVWGAAGGTREQLNTLIHRTRASLGEAGLDGRLLERAPGGGAVRFALPDGATIEVARADGARLRSAR